MPKAADKPNRTRKRAITPADERAAARLKAIAQGMPADRRLTQEAIAEQWGEGANQSLISQYMNGGIALNYRAVLRFAEILDCHPSEIRDDLPEQQVAARLSLGADDGVGWEDVVGYAQAVGLGAGAEAQEYAETHKLKFRTESLRRKGLRPPALAVYYGQGDSMEPRIRAGDAILFDTSDTRPVDGAIYLVCRDGEINVKRCEIIDDIVYFRSDNPAGDHTWRKPRRMDHPSDPITIHGRVRWIGSWES